MQKLPRGARGMNDQVSIFDELPTSAPLEPSLNRHTAILLGRDTTDRIVAVEPSETSLRVWRRMLDDSIVVETEPLDPWILTTSPQPILGPEPRELEEEGFRFLYTFPSHSSFQDARFRLRDEHIEHLTYASATKLALIRSGKTLFK